MYYDTGRTYVRDTMQKNRSSYTSSCGIEMFIITSIKQKTQTIRGLLYFKDIYICPYIIKAGGRPPTTNSLRDERDE